MASLSPQAAPALHTTCLALDPVASFSQPTKTFSRPSRVPQSKPSVSPATFCTYGTNSKHGATKRGEKFKVPEPELPHDTITNSAELTVLGRGCKIEVGEPPRSAATVTRPQTVTCGIRGGTVGGFRGGKMPLRGNKKKKAVTDSASIKARPQTVHSEVRDTKRAVVRQSLRELEEQKRDEQMERMFSQRALIGAKSEALLNEYLSLWLRNTS